MRKQKASLGTDQRRRLKYVFEAGNEVAPQGFTAGIIEKSGN